MEYIDPKFQRDEAHTNMTRPLLRPLSLVPNNQLQCNIITRISSKTYLLMQSLSIAHEGCLSSGTFLDTPSDDTLQVDAGESGMYAIEFKETLTYEL